MFMRIKKVAVIGSGALSHTFVRLLPRVLPNDYTISCIMARHLEHAEELAHELSCRACTDIDELLIDQPDIVIEIASTDAVRQYAEHILENGSDVVILSVGALADPLYRDHIEMVARRNNRKIHLVSGAIGAFDLMTTISLMGLHNAEITSRYPRETLQRFPCFKDQALSETDVEEVFLGTARDAIARFPRSVNVAVGTALAMNAPDMKVHLKSVPGLHQNEHEIVLRGEYVDAELTIHARPSRENPHSSAASAWSIIALLKNLADPIQFF